MKKSVLDYLKELDQKIDSLTTEEVVDFIGSSELSGDANKYYAFLETRILPDCSYAAGSLLSGIVSLEDTIEVDEGWADAA
jgi:hypothetical protein